MKYCSCYLNRRRRFLLVMLVLLVLLLWAVAENPAPTKPWN